MKKMIALASALALMGATGGAIAGGQDTYTKSCNACHGTGAAGAPKTGDKAAWKDRLAQGNDTLYEHAIKGFKGKTGYMPAKGGFANLSDDEVKAAVDYMVAQSK
jgi:cytochrome c5